MNKVIIVTIAMLVAAMFLGHVSNPSRLLDPDTAPTVDGHMVLSTENPIIVK